MVKDLILKLTAYMHAADDFREVRSGEATFTYYSKCKMSLERMEKAEKEVAAAADKLDELLKQLGESK